VFYCPKVYGLIDMNGNEVVKCKRYKNKISFNELKSLLTLNNKLELPQDKRYSSLETGGIKIKNQTIIYSKNKIEVGSVFETFKLLKTKKYFVF
jgi:hypothetical protein